MRFPLSSITFLSNRFPKISLFFCASISFFFASDSFLLKYLISRFISLRCFFISSCCFTLSTSSACFMNLFSLFNRRLLLPLEANRVRQKRFNLLETIRESLKILLILGSTLIVKCFLFKMLSFLLTSFCLIN